MLDSDLKAQLQSYLERVVRPIDIVANLDDSQSATELQGLLADLQACSTQIRVRETRDAGTRAPAFTLNSPGQDIGVTFGGLPLGHEFTSLVLALLQVGATRRKSATNRRHKFAVLMARSRLKPSIRCHARTVPMWCRR